MHFFHYILELRNDDATFLHSVITQVLPVAFLKPTIRKAVGYILIEPALLHTAV